MGEWTILYVDNAKRVKKILNEQMKTQSTGRRASRRAKCMVPKRYLAAGYAILFAATILAARKLNDPESKPWGIECAISDAIGKAERILQKIEERWPSGEIPNLS